MKTYSIVGQVTVSCTIKVKAKSEKEALSKAQGMPFKDLCYLCSQTDEDGWTIDVDGEPVKLSIDEEDSEEE